MIKRKKISAIITLLSIIIINLSNVFAVNIGSVSVSGTTVFNSNVLGW